MRYIHKNHCRWISRQPAKHFFSRAYSVLATPMEISERRPSKNAQNYQNLQARFTLIRNFHFLESAPNCLTTILQFRALTPFKNEASHASQTGFPTHLWIVRKTLPFVHSQPAENTKLNKIYPPRPIAFLFHRSGSSLALLFPCLPCNSWPLSVILVRFERRWRSSAGRASDL